MADGLAPGGLCPWCRQGTLTKHCDGRIQLQAGGWNTSTTCDLLKCPRCKWFGAADRSHEHCPAPDDAA